MYLAPFQAFRTLLTWTKEAATSIAVPITHDFVIPREHLSTEFSSPKPPLAMAQPTGPVLQAATVTTSWTIGFLASFRTDFFSEFHHMPFQVEVVDGVVDVEVVVAGAALYGVDLKETLQGRVVHAGAHLDDSPKSGFLFHRTLLRTEPRDLRTNNPTHGIHPIRRLVRRHRRLPRKRVRRRTTILHLRNRINHQRRRPLLPV